MIILEKCAVISCSKEVYEDEQRVLAYCLGHAWLDPQYKDEWQAAWIRGGHHGASN